MSSFLIASCTACVYFERPLLANRSSGRLAGLEDKMSLERHKTHQTDIVRA